MNHEQMQNSFRPKISFYRYLLFVYFFRQKSFTFRFPTPLFRLPDLSPCSFLSQDGVSLFVIYAEGNYSHRIHTKTHTRTHTQPRVNLRLHWQKEKRS